MKFLHTSDWHVGKTLKGRSRLDEQEAVLAQIIAVAARAPAGRRAHRRRPVRPRAPSAEAQQLVVKALLALPRTGAEVIAIAGNHDSPTAFDAYRPLMRPPGSPWSDRSGPQTDGGVVSFATGAGERVNVAVLPFLSPSATRSGPPQLVTGTPAENRPDYDDMVREVIGTVGRSLHPGMR